MSGHITLSTEDQTTLTNALRLEQAGFPASARYLLKTIRALDGIDWDSADPQPGDTDGYAALYRAHRGSDSGGLPSTPSPSDP